MSALSAGPAADGASEVLSLALELSDHLNLMLSDVIHHSLLPVASPHLVDAVEPFQCSLVDQQVSFLWRLLSQLRTQSYSSYELETFCSVVTKRKLDDMNLGSI